MVSLLQVKGQLNRQLKPGVATRHIIEEHYLNLSCKSNSRSLRRVEVLLLHFLTYPLAFDGSVLYFTNFKY